MTTLYCRYCTWRGGSFSHLLTHYAVWHDPQSPFNVRVSPLYEALGMARAIAEDIQEIQITRRPERGTITAYRRTR